MKSTELYRKIQDAAKKAGVELFEAGGVEPNPRHTTLNRVAGIARENACDGILAVGGGSVIDCAKFAGAAVFHDGDAWDFFKGKAKMERFLPLLAIPTLAGTGTDMDALGIVSNEETLEKIPLFHEGLFPKTTFLDPTLTYTVPPFQTACGSMDALTHYLEVYLMRPHLSVHLRVMQDPAYDTGKDGPRQVGLAKREELARFVVPDRKYFRLGFRDIARDTNERTLIAAVVPPDIGAQNKLPLSVPKRYVLEAGTVGVKETSLVRLFFEQGLFNSPVVDWMLRFSVGMTVNKTYLMRLPVPQPDDGEILENPVYEGICRNSMLLSCAHDRERFFPLLGQFAIGDGEVPETDGKILALRVENDVLVARAYGVSRAELLYILDSFPIFKGKCKEYRELLSHAFGRRQNA